MNILFQFICIVTTQPTEPTPNMCKARPTTNNGEEISSSNTEVGLINFSAEGWSLNKPHHRTEIVTSLLLIILLLFGAYKLKKRCIKSTSKRGKETHTRMNQATIRITTWTSYQTSHQPQHMTTSKQHNTPTIQHMNQFNPNTTLLNQNSNKNRCHII